MRAAGRQAVWRLFPHNLVTSPGEQEESRCQRCISELKDIRLQLEACETRVVHRLRLPLDKDPARECAQRIAEQQAGTALTHSSPLLPIQTSLAFRGSWLSGPGGHWAPTWSLYRKRRPRWKGWARELSDCLLRLRKS